MMRRNPWSWDSYYKKGCFAHHLITKPYFQNFSRVWKQGALLSDTARRQAGKRTRGHIYSTDRLAGDGDYVFLSLGAPADNLRHWGYAFIFPALQIVRDYDVKVGVVDLMNARMYIIKEEIALADDKDVTFEDWPRTYVVDSIRERFEELDEHFRLCGDDAIKYVSQICHDGKMPDFIKSSLWWSRRERIGMGQREVWLPGTLEQLEGMSEILVPEALPISDAVGVCYAKVYFEMPDFIRLLGNRKSLPKIRLEPAIGFPYRCPFCSNPLVLGDTLLQVIESRPWFRVIDHGDISDVLQCASCGIYFKRGKRDIDFIEVDKRDFPKATIVGW